LSPITAEVEDMIATVTIRRPEKRNAMTFAMWREIARLYADLQSDGSVRAIVLRGETDFSVGADISEFATLRADAERSLAYEAAIDAASDAIAACSKPTIAAISGYCLGGGCHLALACDFRFVESSAKIAIPSARLSIVYNVASTRRLLALVGLSQAKRMLFTAERLEAEEACRIGLGDRLCGDVFGEAAAFVRTMRDNAPLSIAGSKFILDGLTTGNLDEEAVRLMTMRAIDSEDFKEGRTAFAERRPPIFRGV
jgi:enoyl-CoA hydratase/carnithine racemase